MASRPIYQFYAELADYAPRMWRRFQTADNITLARLGYIIMTMFEMKASHLFCFDVPTDGNFKKTLLSRMSEEEMMSVFDEEKFEETSRYEIRNEMTEPDENSFDVAQTRLSGVVCYPEQRLSFSYDFGDGWEVTLVLETVISDKELPGKELPRVLEGEGFGIIEDCGGPGGLMDIAEAFKKKKGEQYAEYCEWLGVSELDLNRFDIEDMNFRLKKLPRIFADIYENDLEPTQRSVDLIERKYMKS